jgi:hypothetical protein
MEKNEMRAASIARMPRVTPPKSGTHGTDSSGHGGEHDGELKELKEVTALQVRPSMMRIVTKLTKATSSPLSSIFSFQSPLLRLIL